MSRSHKDSGSAILLDTNLLIRHWQRSGPPAEEKAAREAAAELVRIHDTASIVSVVYLEFVCGIGSQREMTIAEAFLAEFEIAGGWEVRESDLLEARRMARRVPSNGKRRQFGNCLIKAIANRLRLIVRTLDDGFPRT